MKPLKSFGFVLVVLSICYIRSNAVSIVDQKFINFIQKLTTDFKGISKVDFENKITLNKDQLLLDETVKALIRYKLRTDQDVKNYKETVRAAIRKQDIKDLTTIQRDFIAVKEAMNCSRLGADTDLLPMAKSMILFDVDLETGHLGAAGEYVAAVIKYLHARLSEH